jgi:hypothetical protein
MGSNALSYPGQPAQDAVAVPDATLTVLTDAGRGVYVGGAGNLVVEMAGGTGTDVTFTAVPAGTVLPIAVKRVLAASTATAVVVLL